MTMKVKLGIMNPRYFENGLESTDVGAVIPVVGVLGSNSYPIGNSTQISVKGNLSVLFAFPSMIYG